jgi:cell filamentation protein
MDGYFTKNDEILENKLGIYDSDVLKKAEADICYIRQIEVENMPLPNAFDFTFLLLCHKYLFDDIYFFAGKIRTVDITKGNVPFCYVQNIEAEQRRIFTSLRKEAYLAGLEKDVFVDRLAFYSSELNALHPFREGNGRSIRLFLRLLAKSCGYLLQFHLCKPEELLNADVQAYIGDRTLLISLYHRIVAEINIVSSDE